MLPGVPPSKDPNVPPPCPHQSSAQYSPPVKKQLLNLEAYGEREQRMAAVLGGLMVCVSSRRLPGLSPPHNPLLPPPCSPQFPPQILSLNAPPYGSPPVKKRLLNLEAYGEREQRMTAVLGGKRLLNLEAYGEREQRMAAVLGGVMVRVSRDAETGGFLASHPLLVDTCCLLIGSFADWLNLQPDCLLGVISYLLKALQVPEAVRSAAGAFRAVCARCAPHLEIRQALMEGQARVIASLPPATAAPLALSLTSPHIQLAAQLAQMQTNETSGFGSTSDGGGRSSTGGAIVITALCHLFRHSLLCLKHPSPPILPSIAPLVTAFEEHQHPAVLEVLALVLELSASAASAGGAAGDLSVCHSALQACSISAFSLIQVRRSQVSLSRVSLSQVSLSQVSLSQVSLSQVSLSQVSLSQVSLSQVSLSQEEPAPAPALAPAVAGALSTPLNPPLSPPNILCYPVHHPLLLLSLTARSPPPSTRGAFSPIRHGLSLSALRAAPAAAGALPGGAAGRGSSHSGTRRERFRQVSAHAALLPALPGQEGALLPCLDQSSPPSLPSPPLPSPLPSTFAPPLPLPLLSLRPSSPFAPPLPSPLLSLRPSSPFAPPLPLLLLSPCFCSPLASALPLLLLSPCFCSPLASALPLLLLSPCFCSPLASALPLLIPSTLSAQPVIIASLDQSVVSPPLSPLPFPLPSPLPLPNPLPSPLSPPFSPLPSPLPLASPLSPHTSIPPSAQPVIITSLQHQGQSVISSLLLAAAGKAPRDLLRPIAIALHHLILLPDLHPLLPNWLVTALRSPDFQRGVPEAVGEGEMQLFCELVLRQPPLPRQRFEALVADFAALCRCSAADGCHCVCSELQYRVCVAAAAVGEGEMQLFCELVLLRQPPLPRQRFEELVADFAAICRSEGAADALLGYQM
ncbi:unnamed protein product [Closterium sp. Naga37s-1]|nr:unnamed protein product [Closterium sp. Naga37s-1]